MFHKKYIAKIFLVVLFSLTADLFAAERIVETSPINYYPSKLQVQVGDTVSWFNKDMVDHEMDFNGNPTPSTDENLYIYLPKNKTLSVVITKPGIYPYKCSWHGMFGVIEVYLVNK